ncbi:MAG: hypothetical protein OXT09_07265, partial [Myxococcales bacterium]|nr:hypothetical protein [Myxococcales bacterium]
FPSPQRCEDEEVLGQVQPDGSAIFRLRWSRFRPGTSEAVVRSRSAPTRPEDPRVTVTRSPSLVWVRSEPPYSGDGTEWPRAGRWRWRIRPFCHPDFSSESVFPPEGRSVAIELTADPLRAASAGLGNVELGPLHERCPEVASALRYEVDALAAMLRAQDLPTGPDHWIARGPEGYLTVTDTVELDSMAGTRASLELQLQLNSHYVNAALLRSLDAAWAAPWAEPERRRSGLTPTLVLHRPGEGFGPDALTVRSDGFRTRRPLLAALRGLPMDALLQGAAVRQVGLLAIVHYTRQQVSGCPGAKPTTGTVRSVTIEVRVATTGRRIARKTFEAAQPSCDQVLVASDRWLGPDLFKGWPDFSRMRAFIERQASSR